MIARLHSIGIKTAFPASSGECGRADSQVCDGEILLCQCYNPPMPKNVNAATGITKPQTRWAVRIEAMIVNSETNGAPKNKKVMTRNGGP